MIEVSPQPETVRLNSALSHLNGSDGRAAAALLEPLVERSPWVAVAALSERPFVSGEAVAEALIEVILSADLATRRAVFRAHPELAGEEAAAGRMTEASTDEQSRLGLTSLAAGEADRLANLNASYRSRFGYPYIVALHRVPDLRALFADFERRLKANPVEEHVTALAEIASVIRRRATGAFGGRDGKLQALETETKESIR